MSCFTNVRRDSSRHTAPEVGVSTAVPPWRYVITKRSHSYTATSLSRVWSGRAQSFGSKKPKNNPLDRESLRWQHESIRWTLTKPGKVTLDAPDSSPVWLRCDLAQLHEGEKKEKKKKKQNLWARFNASAEVEFFHCVSDYNHIPALCSAAGMLFLERRRWCRVAPKIQTIYKKKKEKKDSPHSFLLTTLWAQIF